MREKICIITAHYYQKITSDLYNGATLVLNKHKISSEWIKVPGVFEIPVTIVKNIESYDAFIALGCVIKGETPHFDLISKATVNAIMDLSIKYKKQIGNGITSGPTFGSASGSKEGSSGKINISYYFFLTNLWPKR